MKKNLRYVILVAGFLIGNNAYAVDIVFDTTNIVQNTITATKSALTAAKSEIIAAKTAISAATDEWVKEHAWVQQFKDMAQTIKDINKAREELTSEITGMTSYVTDYFNKAKALAAGKPGSKASWDYAQSSPDQLVASTTCADGKECVVDGTGYVGPATGTSSFTIRNSLKVDPSEVGSLLGAKSIKQISREAAELNAQEQAVIDAMAREAFIQASNRVKNIQYLEQGLTNPPAGMENDLKYTTDIQAMIIAQQALLTNDQNRIAALAVLQQSQRDRYEQRKKEIANYVAYGDRDAGQAVERAAIVLATKGAYEALEGWYE